MNTIVFRIGNFLYKKIDPVLATRLAYSPLGKAFFYSLNGFSRRKKPFTSTDNIKVLLTPDEALGFGIFHVGTINKLESDLMRKLLKEGDTVFDIGTFVDGWHSLLAAKLVEKRKGLVV